ncbi:MAG: glycosyltransferase [Patiriisocius sp.]|uniref:glycosyltransferase n=1 Tax=Patiriisocius sp. TaxID=2822396 RepID=UPI003EF0D14E
MKVAIVYHYFAHYREPVLSELCDELRDVAELALISGDKAEFPNLKILDLTELEAQGCYVHRVENKWRGLWLWQKGLLSHLNQEKYDAVIFLGQFNFLSTWCAVPVVKRHGGKVFFWTHGVYGNEGKFKLWLRESFYRWADGLLLYGHYSRKLLEKRGFASERLNVIYNSLDYRVQLELRKKIEGDCEQIPNRTEFKNLERPYLIFVGRLTAVKSLDMLVNSVFELRKKGKNIACLFVGDGPELDALEQQVSRLDIHDFVEFHGACHDEELLARMIYHAAVCVAPGNVGLTAMHSLVYGTPVITHDESKSQMPEFESITANVNGDFYRRGDQEDLTCMIDKWLARCEMNRCEVRRECYKPIDEDYNPMNQAKIIKDVLDRSLSC